jgi:hypothetical protein
MTLFLLSGSLTPGMQRHKETVATHLHAKMPRSTTVIAAPVIACVGSRGRRAAAFRPVGQILLCGRNEFLTLTRA